MYVYSYYTFLSIVRDQMSPLIYYEYVINFEYDFENAFDFWKYIKFGVHKIHNSKI